MCRIPSLLGALLWTCAVCTTIRPEAASAAAASKASEHFIPAATTGRLLVFISDTHLGVGRLPNGNWSPREDFRWPGALAGFLDFLTKDSNDAVDLFIVGDFLEMWQPPPGVACHGPDADAQCTLDDMEAMSKLIVAAHQTEFSMLRNFSRRGSNRIHIIPGNHDASLLFEQAWRPVGNALGAESGRIEIITSGIWTSPDGRVMAEHGHQIGADVNGYGAAWPNIVRTNGQKNYLIQSWGEQFVQKIFNDQEDVYPIIDNLSPETAGARYRMADRGLWKSAGDVARFLAFNLFETSVSQKLASLGRDAGGRPAQPSIPRAKALGHELFLAALQDGDPIRDTIADSAPQSQELKAELDKLTRQLSDQQLYELCDQAALRHGPVCSDTTLGALVQTVLVPRARVLKSHLLDRRNDDGRLRLFIYGHTHQYEMPWDVDLDGLNKVTVVNTGAFQRLITDDEFLVRIKKLGITPQEGLRQLPLDSLPPCYTFVSVSYPDGVLSPELKSWHMQEGGPGDVVAPDSDVCR